MSASPPLPLLKRIPPGLWTALVWFAAAVQPIVEYVLMPAQRELSYSYPRDGLDSNRAQQQLTFAFLLVLFGCRMLRRRPLTAYGLVLAGTAFSTLAWRQHQIPPMQFLGVDVALCSIAATRSRRSSLTAAAAALGMLAAYFTVRTLKVEDYDGIAPEPYVALTVVIAWLVGNSVHQARAHTEELHARAAAQAVTAERLRIAREMHDTVAHSIGIIALQAGAAARVVETRPAKAREAMLTVEKAGRETLSGLRRMLSALRQADQEQGQFGHEHGQFGQEQGQSGQDQDRGQLGQGQERAQAPLRPAAGLAGVERLAATTTAAGVRVEAAWQGRPRPLPADIDLAAYRIVQESVTNVVRHSGAASCRVGVEYRDEDLVIAVSDRGRGGGTRTDTGYGLVGMRERVALLHGDFTAGPLPQGGFLVTAVLPIPAAAETETETKAGAR
ncbi:sensor histidine kinase [Streptomyces sp. E11-3]|uniref:sensor histidine kinase n=1 Tax=Streptomyces sp. E11-3 TaxID=3110112 RepID=UPI00398082DF